MAISGLALEGGTWSSLHGGVNRRYAADERRKRKDMSKEDGGPNSRQANALLLPFLIPSVSACLHRISSASICAYLRVNFFQHSLLLSILFMHREITPADHPELRALYHHLHGCEIFPSCLLSCSDHLVHQRLIRQGHSAPQATYPNSLRQKRRTITSFFFGQQVAPQPIEAAEFRAVFQFGGGVDRQTRLILSARRRPIGSYCLEGGSPAGRSADGEPHTLVNAGVLLHELPRR